MNIDDILILGLKHRVAAIFKPTGREIWSTEMRGGGLGGGSNFVTLVATETHVFAYSGGALHCLDLFTGRLVWVNELPGYGYGLATLALPGQASAPNLAAIRQFIAQQESSSAAATP